MKYRQVLFLPDMSRLSPKMKINLDTDVKKFVFLGLAENPQK